MQTLINGTMLKHVESLTLFKFIEDVGSSHLDKFPKLQLEDKKIRNKYMFFVNLTNEQ